MRGIYSGSVARVEGSHTPPPDIITQAFIYGINKNARKRERIAVPAMEFAPSFSFVLMPTPPQTATPAARVTLIY
jgi:hypothetical protein